MWWRGSQMAIQAWKYEQAAANNTVCLLDNPKYSSLKLHIGEALIEKKQNGPDWTTDGERSRSGFMNRETFQVRYLLTSLLLQKLMLYRVSDLYISGDARSSTEKLNILFRPSIRPILRIQYRNQMIVDICGEFRATKSSFDLCKRPRDLRTIKTCSSNGGRRSLEEMASLCSRWIKGLKMNGNVDIGRSRGILVTYMWTSSFGLHKWVLSALELDTASGQVGFQHTGCSMVSISFGTRKQERKWWDHAVGPKKIHRSYTAQQKFFSPPGGSDRYSCGVVVRSQLVTWLF